MRLLNLSMKSQKKLPPSTTDERFLAAATNASVPTAYLWRDTIFESCKWKKMERIEPMYVPNDGTPVTLEHVLPSQSRDGLGTTFPLMILKQLQQMGNQAR